MGLRYKIASTAGLSGWGCAWYAITAATDPLLYWGALSLGFLALLISTFLFSQIIVEWLESHWPSQMPMRVRKQAPIFVVSFCMLILTVVCGTYGYVSYEIEKIQKSAQQKNVEDAAEIRALDDQIVSLKQQDTSRSKHGANSSHASVFGNMDGTEDVTMTNNIMPSQVTSSFKNAKRVTIENNLMEGH
jgi:hypothetical protein